MLYDKVNFHSRIFIAVIVYEGTKQQWAQIADPQWSYFADKMSYIFSQYQYDNFDFYEREMRKRHELKSGVNSGSQPSYVSGGGITIDGDTIKINTGEGVKIDSSGSVTITPATQTTIGGVKAGEGVEISDDGTLSFTGGGTEYKAGTGINIAVDVISVKPATANTLGGVKIGNGLKISEDGTVETDGGGGSYTAGNGIEITEDDTINLKQATSTQLGGVILGEGLEYDATTGKTNTVPNIQQAVIIQEADAKYLLHEYTTVEYIAGNKIVYNGPDSVIITQGYLTNKNVGTFLEPATDEGLTNFLEKTKNFTIYSEFDFKIPAVSSRDTNKKEITKITNTLQSITSTYNTYLITRYYIDGTTDSFTFQHKLGSDLPLSMIGMVLQVDEIYAPGVSYGGFTSEYGFAYCLGGCIYTSSGYSTSYVVTSDSNLQLLIPFASEAEYNAAVGLTYEPQTLVNVEETITEV